MFFARYFPRLSGGESKVLTCNALSDELIAFVAKFTFIIIAMLLEALQPLLLRFFKPIDCSRNRLVILLYRVL